MFTVAGVSKKRKANFSGNMIKNSWNLTLLQLHVINVVNSRSDP